MSFRESIFTLRKLLSRNPFTKNVVILASGTAFAQFINIIITPAISRIYTPADFGVLSVYTSLLGIMQVFIALRYELAIPIADDDHKAIIVLKLCVFLVSALSAMYFVLFVFFGDIIISTLKIQETEHFLILLPIGVFLSGLYNVFRFYSLRLGNFKIVTKSQIIQSSTQSGIKILLGFLRFGSVGLLLGNIVGQTLGTSSIIIRSLRKKHIRIQIREIRLSEIRKIAKRYKRFPLISSWSAILNSIGTQLPVLILSAFFDTEAVGFFGFAQRIINLPLTLIAISVGQVYYSEGSKIKRETPSNLFRLMLTTYKKLSIIGLLPSIILFAFGPLLFSIVFGEPWYEAGVYARILSIMLFARFSIGPIVQTLNIIEKQGTLLSLDFIRVTLTLSLMYLSQKYFPSPEIVVISYSLGLTISYLISFFTIFRILRKYSVSDEK